MISSRGDGKNASFISLVYGLAVQGSHRRDEDNIIFNCQGPAELKAAWELVRQP